MTSAEEHHAESAAILARIRGLHGLFEQVIKDLRGDLDRFEAAAPGDELLRGADYWQHVIAYDSSVRLRQIIESNFHVIETLALLATTRYVFELSIWLKLGTTREDYALAYYRQLLEKQVEQCEQRVNQLGRECDLLEALDARDTQPFDMVGDPGATDPNEMHKHVEARMAEVDREAARIFSLYADRAKTLGYGYTAHLVRTQALQRALQLQKQAREAREDFLAWCPPSVKALVERSWRWQREAKVAGMEGSYEFLYSFVSRLLHATPASITTDQKHLEPEEITVFLRYLYGALLDALDLASALRARGA